MDENNNLTELEGIVESVMFTNPDNGYIVLDLDVKGDYVTVVGELGNIEEGEELIVTGEYVKHAKLVCNSKLNIANVKCLQQQMLS